MILGQVLVPFLVGAVEDVAHIRDPTGSRACVNNVWVTTSLPFFRFFSVLFFRIVLSIRIGWQGHCNPICAVAVSHNKKWVATADAGRDSMMVVWDTASGTPIKSIFNPHLNGVLAMDISADALFIVTLSDPGESGSDGEDTEPQTISVWEWTHPSRKEALFTGVIDEPDIQKVSYRLSVVRSID